MTPSSKLLQLFSGRGHSQIWQWVRYVTAPWVPDHMHTTWHDHRQCAEPRFSTLYDMIYLDLHLGYRQKQENKKAGRGGGRRGREANPKRNWAKEINSEELRAFGQFVPEEEEEEEEEKDSSRRPRCFIFPSPPQAKTL